jgi:hypothetical protein
MADTTPCPTCPWRRSSTVGGTDIPNFDIDLMRGLRNTVGEGDAFRTIMACHYSECGGEKPCIGYLAQEGYSNLSVRLMAIHDEIDLRQIWKNCKSLALWPDFETMLAAYEEAQ